MRKLFNLNARDFIKGGVMFVGSAVLAALIQALQNGLNVDWAVIINVALVSTLTYLLKNLSTDDEGKIGGKL
jgi:hypothetical protein